MDLHLSATCSSHSNDLKSTNLSNMCDLNNTNTYNDITLNTDDEDTILSIGWKNGMLGAASYSSNLSEIQILYDVVESNLDFKMLSALFMQVRPAYIVVCSLQDGAFLKIVKQLAHSGKINIQNSSINNNDYKSDEKVFILPKQCFKFKNCEQLILSMPLASAPKNEKSRRRYLRNLIDFTQELAVCALGALLYFVDSPLAKLNLPTDFIILSLRILKMDDVVWIGVSTYETLQIFSAHEHPSAYKWSNNTTKEGSSIFNMLNRCHSVLGSKYLKNILSQPINNYNELKYRHEVIEFCLKPCNKSIKISLINCIKHCCCVLLTMVKINSGSASIYQWKLLYKTIINAVTIGEICERYSREITFFRKIKEALTDNLYAMVNSMSCIIDFEQSSEQDKFIVKSGFIPELDEKKFKTKNISKLLDEITLQELKNLPLYINKCSIHKMPEMGFLLCLPLWKPSNQITEHDYKIPNLEFKFRLTDNVYYKTLKCYELDQLFDEIESSIIQEEIQIMIKLSELITHNWIGDLHAILMLIAELDCLLGFADVAQDLKLIKPKILPKEYCIINIINGRHLLQEKYVKKYVPNSYNSSKKNQPIKIITGFNSSGKSIYLKQVALISYLCHVGCYVPAEYVEISLLDHIHTRIQTTESVSTLMSAFMVDLRQMSVALNESTCRSLIILDEFGKGTSEINGIALLLACISHLVHRPINLLPHVIVSTHYHTLSNFLQQIIDKDVLHHNIKYQYMSYRIENSIIVYLYKVVNKIENQNMSMTHHIAAINGLPTHIVERAVQVLLSVHQNECLSPINENLRYKLLSRRKQFIEKILNLIQDEITESIYKELVDDLESVRYP